MNWDGFQREALTELGLRPYALVAAGGQVAAGEERMPQGMVIPQELLAALARAGGCAPEQVVVLARIDATPLDAAAKRALWPRLRRLRAGL